MRPRLLFKTGPVLLLSTLVFVPACEPDECNVDFVVTGAVEYTYALSASNAECTSTTDLAPGVPGKLRFEANDGVILTITLRGDDDLTIGTHFADVTFSSAAGIWATDYDGSATADCVVAVISSEIVDWVKNDHRRVSGAVECVGPLTGSSGTIEITGLSFYVYASNSPY